MTQIRIKFLVEQVVNPNGHGAQDFWIRTLAKPNGKCDAIGSDQLGHLQRAGLVRCEHDGVRTIWSADDDLVEDLCNLVQNHFMQRLEQQLKQLQAVP